MKPSTDQTITWLLDGDPAIRWQTMRDLNGAPTKIFERERRRVERDGWGARLLSRQGSSGKWASGKESFIGLYNPKWISTTYTMLLLRDFGLPPENPNTLKACKLLLDGGLQRDGGISYGTWAQSTHRGETCISGMVLSLLSYFRFKDTRLETIAGYVLGQQMPDGGWNCRRPYGATHSSVHTTIMALEGLRHYELTRSKDLRAIRRAQVRGREFLLAHRLFRSHRTGNIMRSEFLRFSFPPRWHYDILRALDYFRAVDAPRDPRLRDAIDIVRNKRCEDGRWLLEHTHRGRVYFALERDGAPSRWNTLRALRVLKWWENGQNL